MTATPENTPEALAALRKRLDEVNQAIAERRVEELKVLADGYVKKCQVNGFTVAEALNALKPYLPRRGAGSGEVRYRDPAEYTNTWSGKGRMPGWLAAYVAAGRDREDFLV